MPLMEICSVTRFNSLVVSFAKCIFTIAPWVTVKSLKAL